MPERVPLPTQLTSSGIVAIARATSAARVNDAVEILVASGIRCIELTMTMPDALAGITSLIARLGDEVCIGAGTVLTADQAHACIDAGAKFLVAPSVVPRVVEIAVGAGIPCLPGAFTPSEIVTAWESGAAAVKLFPASVGGAAYLRNVRAPLPDVALVPTGGVAIADVPGYLAAGAVAVGVGGPLFGDALDGGDLAGLAQRARALVDAVHTARRERAV